MIDAVCCVLHSGHFSADRYDAASNINRTVSHSSVRQREPQVRNAEQRRRGRAVAPSDCEASAHSVAVLCFAICAEYRSSKHDSKHSSDSDDDDDADDQKHSKSKKHGAHQKKKPHKTSVATQTVKMPAYDPDAPSSSSKQPRSTNSSIINSADACNGPFPGYPYCQDHVDWMTKNWAITPEQEAYYRSKGVDGTQCSFLTYLNLNGFYCPEAADATKRTKIRGVNLGGWLVLEPWIVPSLFEQFAVTDGVQDQWTFCARLGAKECHRQLEKHWDSWLQQSDLKFLAESGINHVRIPVGYWLFGDIRRGEPWVAGELPYLERAIKWCRDLGLHVVLDLHCAPGSQNGFDNSGRKGEVHFDDEEKSQQGRVSWTHEAGRAHALR